MHKQSLLKFHKCTVIQNKNAELQFQDRSTSFHNAIQIKSTLPSVESGADVVLLTNNNENNLIVVFNQFLRDIYSGNNEFFN